MLSPFVLQRLGALNLSESPGWNSLRDACPTGLGPPFVATPTPPPHGPAGEAALDGCEAEGPRGAHWRWQRPVRALWPALDDHWDASARRCMTACGSKEHPDLRALASSFPRTALFVDLETCGFAGCAIFLIGLIHWQEDLLLTQLLARNYAEEQAVLASLWELTVGKQVLVTFNGKSFDWPMVEDRTTLHRLGRNAGAQWVHCDLLHHARRRWKDALPDCRLQTLERSVCRRWRSGDVPGQHVPAAYHDYVRTGDPWLMRGILEHNVLDLITLLELASILTRPI